MGIRREYGHRAAAKAGLQTGRRAAAKEASKEAAQRAAQLQRQREQQQYDMSVREMQMEMSLEAERRARAWQIEKMEIASRLDFEREERDRQRRLESIDNKLRQLEKEKDEGRFSADDRAYSNAVAYWESQKTFVETGIRPPKGGKQYGVEPYWMEYKQAPEGTPERQLYESKLEQQVSGVRTGTLPWYLDPRYIRSTAAEEERANRGIFLDPEDIDEFLGMGRGGEAIKAPITDLPRPKSRAEYDALPKGTRYIDPEGNVRTK